jgi:hypothetical protein
MTTRRRTVTIIMAIGIAGFVASFVFYGHLMHISPTVPNPATCQVYELNQHGHLFYVTSGQHSTFFTLQLGGWGLMFMAVVLSQLSKLRRKSSWRRNKHLTNRWSQPLFAIRRSGRQFQRAAKPAITCIAL